MLDALQELTRLAVQSATGERSRLMLDVAGHRAERRATLVEVARGAIEDVKATGEKAELEPMTAFERKVVHDEVLAAGLVSESDGVEPQAVRRGAPGWRRRVTDCVVSRETGRMTPSADDDVDGRGTGEAGVRARRRIPRCGPPDAARRRRRWSTLGPAGDLPQAVGFFGDALPPAEAVRPHPCGHRGDATA